MTKGIESAQKSKDLGNEISSAQKISRFSRGLGNFCKGALIGLGGLILSHITNPGKAFAVIKPVAPEGVITEEISNDYYDLLREYYKSIDKLYLNGDLRLAYFNSSESDSSGTKVRGTGFSPRADIFAKYQFRGRVNPSVHANTEMESCNGSMLYDSADIASLNITNTDSSFTAGCDIDIAKDGKLYSIISPRIGVGIENRSALINAAGFGGIDHQENYNSSIVELGYEQGIFSANLRYGTGQGSIVDKIGDLMNEAQKKKAESSLEVNVKNLTDENSTKFSLRFEIGQKNYDDTKNNLYNAEMLLPVGKNLELSIGYGGVVTESNSYKTTSDNKFKLGANYSFNGKYDLKKIFKRQKKKQS
jgi:hypothetical protein